MWLWCSVGGQIGLSGLRARSGGCSCVLVTRCWQVWQRWKCCGSAVRGVEIVLQKVGWLAQIEDISDLQFAKRFSRTFEPILLKGGGVGVVAAPAVGGGGAGVVLAGSLAGRPPGGRYPY
ncbi:hypothetical protein Pmani_034713 [Petrolisthes manimaculis]|uniref:Uncharacterized protein n=1 Tax=Petrolisthes manimaculis TaxID=1843537 RepID=A0AAE1NM08_9EUCA|nr:hypothetical protein Pmani_034713 [Petrolisthes manimaculis]